MHQSSKSSLSDKKPRQIIGIEEHDGVTFKKGQAGVQKNTTENAPQWRRNITDLTYIVPYF